MMLEAHDIFVSVWRWLAGLAGGAFLGLALALYVYRRPVISFGMEGGVSFFRALPVLILAPLASRYVGAGEPSKILIITWMCTFPVFVSTARAIRQPMLDLELRLFLSRLEGIERFRHYHLPRILFGFLAGVEISIGVGWLTVVAAEYLIGTWNYGLFRGGLGHAAFVAYENRRDDVTLICLLAFGALGVSSSYGWARLSKWVVCRLGLEQGTHHK